MATDNHRIELAGLHTKVIAGCLLIGVLMACAAPKVSAAVEEKLDVTHLYNETHSLTGGCLTSGADKVVDPPCSEVPPGPMPPEGPLVRPGTAVTDAYGDQYVVNLNESKSSGRHIDIFDPDGQYIGGIALTSGFGLELAIDSTGHLYTTANSGGNSLKRYDPTLYNPAAGEIEYGAPPVVVAEDFGLIAVDATNDHLYFNTQGNNHHVIYEYGPPTDGVPNELVADSMGDEILNHQEFAGPIAIDAARNEIYVGDWIEAPDSARHALVRVFSLEAPYEQLGSFDGSTTPAGDFGGVPQYFQLAVDEESGDFFVRYLNRVYELEPDGTYVATVRKPAQEGGNSGFTYDNSPLSPNQGYLYVATGEAQGHLYAYEPLHAPEAPTIESTSFEVTGTGEAVLRATINPAAQPTHYRFELTTQADFEENGFANAQLVGEGDLPVSGEGQAVSVGAEGLSPGTAYRFRVVAENQCEPGGCPVEAENGFATFPLYAQSDAACPNQALRTGPSSQLPDCRAYELVSPPSTGGREPFAVSENGPLFGTWAASPAGDSVAFKGTGGAFPGLDTSGGYNGDAYISRRGPGGWSTEAAGLTGRQSSSQIPGGLSPDHSFAVTQALAAGELVGELADPESDVIYVRYRDGSMHLVGEGTIGQDKTPRVRYVSDDGHLFFESPVRLEEAAPPAGTRAIYDRAPDGALHVVSLLPDGSTPAASQGASYEGVSADGSTVAFTLGTGGPLYLRPGDAATVQAAPAGSTFAGLSAQGRYLFYLQGGDLYRFDSAEGATERLTEAGDVTPAYVPAQGTSAYFASEEDLGGGPNPQGDEPQAGEPNLYRWAEGGLSYVATVTAADVEGEPLLGFAEWLNGIDSFGRMPARATADGRVLIFSSRADLTGYHSGGHKQIYRFDAGEGTLRCISCDPTLKVPGTDALLLSNREISGGLNIPGVPAATNSIVPNLSSDGARAFFESEERLVPADEDGLRDVYEWEADGKGSCAAPGGCLYLVSSGKSARPSFLFGASESGDDVFIHTADLLNAEDLEAAPSIYDARVGGGFPPPVPPAGECLGEACQPAAVAPQDPTPGSSTYSGKGNVSGEATPPRRCPKAKRKVRHAGKVRCVPRHPKKTKKANAKRRAHR